MAGARLAPAIGRPPVHTSQSYEWAHFSGRSKYSERTENYDQLELERVVDGTDDFVHSLVRKGIGKMN